MSASKQNRFKVMAGRIIILFLVSLYLLFSIGIVKATHFCMGREASVAFFSEAKKCPCSLFAKEKSSCCDDEHELIRNENEQKVVSAFSLALPQFFVLEKIYTEQFVATTTSVSGESHYFLKIDSPSKVPLYKINCSFVFYDDELIA